MELTPTQALDKFEKENDTKKFDDPIKEFKKWREDNNITLKE